MPLKRYDPRARAKEERERRRKDKAEVRAIEEATLRATNLKQLFGIAPDDRPFWPGCSVRLTVGAIRPMRKIDSIVSKPGLLGDLVASRSSYVLDIPNYEYLLEWLEPHARVEFVLGEQNQVIGLRAMTPTGEPSWIFVVKLTRGLYDAVREFADGVTDVLEWTSPFATLEIRVDQLMPLPPATDPADVSFIGTITSMKVG